MTDTPNKPWTFEPYEIYETPTWVIHDPNLAVDVAVFYTEKEARKYLADVNAKQARKRVKKARKKAEGPLPGMFW